MIYDVEVVWKSTFDPVFVWEKGNERESLSNQSTTWKANRCRRKLSRICLSCNLLSKVHHKVAIKCNGDLKFKFNLSVASSWN